MAGFIFYARSDGAISNDGTIDVLDGGASPVTRLAFRPLTPGRQIRLKSQAADGLPEAVVVIDGASYGFGIEARGALPRSRRLKDVAGIDLRGQEVTVISAAGRRFFFLTGSRATRSTMEAFPAGPLVIGDAAEESHAVLSLTAGTMIMTPDGERAVETLRPGEMVRCADGRNVPLIWRTQGRFTPASLRDMPEIQPIRITQGALGPDLPNRDLTVAAGHRLVIERPENLALFGTAKVLAPARQLPFAGVEPVHAEEPVDYYHLLFERHETILTNGVESESFQPSLGRLAGLGPRARASYRTAVSGPLRRQLRQREDAYYALADWEAAALEDLAEAMHHLTAAA